MSSQREPRRTFLRLSRDEVASTATHCRPPQRGPEPPDPREDFIETRLEDIVSMDLRSATLTIDPTFLCNLRCGFCDLPVTSSLAIEWENFALAVRAMALAGLRRVQVIGGEPEIYSGLEPLLSCLAKLRMNVTLFTHAMWAKDEARLNQLLDLGVRGLVVSLKAFDDDVFHELTKRRRGATVQRAALTHLMGAHASGRLARLEFNHVITRQTLPTLAEDLRSLPRLPRLALTLVEPYSDSMADYVPSPDELRQGLPPVLDVLTEREVPYSLDGVPPCILSPRQFPSRDAGRGDDRALRVYIRPRPEGDYLLVYRGYQRLMQFSQAETCGPCSYAGRCAGVHKRLLNWWPAGSLRPALGGARQ